MKNLLYLSTSRTLLSEEVLLDILNSARKNNAEHNVTGVLIYSEGTFIQVLEGNEDDVDTIFQNIEKDIRHKNVIVLMDEPLEKRNFPDWSMGFTIINSAKSVKFIDDLTTAEKILSKGNDQTAIVMLKSFIESNNLIINN